MRVLGVAVTSVEAPMLPIGARYDYSLSAFRGDRVGNISV